MSAARPLLVVTLPERTLKATLEQLPRLIGFDAAEIRFDRWAPAEIERAGALFPAPLALIATYRSEREGGEGSNDPGVRGRLLAGLGRWPFRYVDLELGVDDELGRRWAEAPGAPARILSRHFPPGSEPADLVPWTTGHQPPGTVVKLVLAASVGEFYRGVRPIAMAGPAGRRETILTTGGSGPLSRALALRFGWAMVFAAPPRTDREQRPAVEPAQIPADRLRRFFDAGASRRLLGLFGRTLDRTASPEIHARWIEAEGRPGLYVPLEVGSASEFASVLGPLADDGLVGANVTRPWKREALANAKEASPRARSAGCANLLLRRPAGWFADNTDVEALGRRLGELGAARPGLLDAVVVFGAGGAARAALAALNALGVGPELVARDRAAERELRSAFGLGPARVEGRPAALLIQTTPIGSEPGDRLDASVAARIAPSTYVLDLVYWPRSPCVREAAQARGAGYEDGGRLLVYQAAASHALFWGERPSAELEEKVLAEVVCAV